MGPATVRGLCIVLAAVCVGGCLAATKMSSCRLRFNNGSEINLMKVAAGLLDAPKYSDILLLRGRDHLSL